ncbi:hypothetical protein ECANGB1_466 [Enterospora canceri]|uniref:DUF8032 domain-containing protein n=1 Tax=Enterospora canceri TaxID=1081671 RepID=A0A1Y1S7Z4_9MICR|nr:hypothetical protein ECANGB1_466 [Enterospora canceri]
MKLQNYEEAEFYSPRVGNDENFTNAPRKKKEKKKRKADEPRKISNRKIVNLPASQPYVKMVDGEERLAFKYNTKLSESVMSSMPKDTVDENEFCVRFDLDSVDITKLNEKFKADNCVYPRANVPYERYSGNRWNYETECNKLACKFVSLNPVLLYGKKGLIQRAVDSYRNICKTSKGSKYFKDEVFSGDIERRRLHANIPQAGHIEYAIRGIQKKCKIHLNIDHVDPRELPAEFVAKYSVMPEEYEPDDFGKEVYEYKNKENGLAVRLAYVNVDNSTFQNVIKQIGVTSAVKLAVQLYRTKRHEAENEQMDAAEVVTETLDQAFNSHKEEEMTKRINN